MPDVYHGVFSIDTSPPEVINTSPATGSIDVDIGTNIEFDIVDYDTGVELSSIVITVDGIAAVTNGIVQTSQFFGEVTETTGGYHVFLNPKEDFPAFADVIIKITASDKRLIPNTLTEYVYTFQTGSDEIPDHIIKYNIYYRPIHRPDWRLSNPEPLNHNLNGNTWVITGLETGASYYVAIVPGTLVNGTWKPLIHQSLKREHRGAGGLNIVENYPLYKVRTFSPT